MDFQKRRENFSIPDEHKNFLKYLKENENINPNVIYDIGSCVFHWLDEAQKVWPNSYYYCFEANTDMKDFYENNKKIMSDYHLGLLSDMTRIVDYYKSNEHPGGNSYYPEIYYGHLYKPIKQTTTTLDMVVKNNNFKKPDMIKIDVQGSEIDVLHGAKKTLKSCNHLIVELQHVQYNKGAYLADESIEIIENEFGFKLINEKFCDNGADADYYFSKINN